MSSNGTAKILVVDDVPENVRLLEAVLVPRGYEVVSATNGEEALDLVESEEPDLILLDVVMPEMDGYAVCRTLRANEDTAVLPVIMVTSSIGPEKTKAIEAGADDFIPKPFNHDELLTRVKSLLRIKRYHDTILELNRTLEERVNKQVEELERLRQLQRLRGEPGARSRILVDARECLLRRGGILIQKERLGHLDERVVTFGRSRSRAIIGDVRRGHSSAARTIIRRDRRSTRLAANVAIDPMTIHTRSPCRSASVPRTNTFCQEVRIAQNGFRFNAWRIHEGMPCASVRM